MRLLVSTALLGFLLGLTTGCSSEKVIMPTKDYDPPTMEDTATSGGATDADQAK